MLILAPQRAWIFTILLVCLHLIPFQLTHAKETDTNETSELWQQAEDLKKAGYYSRAIPYIEKVLADQRAIVPLNKAELARTLDYLGVLNYLAGRYAKAEPLLLESLSSRDVLYGLDYIETADSCFHFGELYTLIGQNEKADASLNKALLIKKKAFGHDHPTVAWCLVALAKKQITTDNLKEADALLKKALAIQEKALAADHPDIVETLNTFAWRYIDTDDYEKTEPFIRRALAIGEKLFKQGHPYLADSLNYLGRLQYARNDYQASISTNKQALSIREKFLGPDHPDVGLTLNNLALPYCGLEQYETAKSLFVKALSIREKAFGINHPKLLVMLQNAAWVHEMLGDYSAAVSFNERALIIKGKQFGSDSIKVANSRKDLAGLWYHLGDAERAENLLNEAQGIFEKILGADHPRVASNLSYLAFLSQAKGNYPKSEELYTRAIVISEKHFEKDPTNLATALSNMAALYVKMGEYEKAEAHYQRALPIIEKAHGPEHTQVAYILNNMGKLYGKLSDNQRAETLYKRAVAIWEKALGPEHPNVATTLDNLAMLYEYAGEYKKAEPLYQRSLKIRKNHFGPEHPNVAKTLNNLATLYSFLGDYDKAVQLYQRTLDAKAETIGTGNASYANTLHNLAASYLKIGQYEKAEPLYNKALGIWIRTYGLDHPDVSTCYGHLSQLYADMGESQKAYDYAMRSLEIDNILIDQVVGFTSEGQKLRFVASNNWGLHYCLNLVNQKYRQNQQKQREAFNAWLKRKGMILDVQKRYQRASILDGNDEAARLFEKLNGVRAELSRLIFLPNRVNVDGYRQRKDELEAERERLEAKLSRISKPFALNQNIAKADSQQVLKALTPGSALLEFARIEAEYFDGTGKLPNRYIAFIVQAGNNNAVKMVDLGLADEIDHIVAEYKRRLTASGNRNIKEALSASRELYGVIFKPIQKALGSEKTIFISPDGNLNLVPFEVLQSPDGGFLIEEYTFNYLSAGRDLLGVTGDQTFVGRCLLMGAPDFDLASTENQTDSTASLVQRSADLGELSFAPLHHAKGELDAISNILGPKQSEIYIGKDALEKTLLNADHPEFIHLATHGFFLSDQDIPGVGRGLNMAELPTLAGQPDQQIKGKIDIENPLLRSGLLLAGAKRSLTEGSNGYHDGIVTAEKILGMNLHGTEMVVLSACDTGLGEVKSGEGVFGLRRAFSQAGANSLVMSMWKVPDKETKELMVQFYKNIKSGNMNRCQALRQAILKEKEIVKKRYGYDNPRYWGAFVFMGQP